MPGGVVQRADVQMFTVAELARRFFRIGPCGPHFTFSRDDLCSNTARSSPHQLPWRLSRRPCGNSPPVCDACGRRPRALLPSMAPRGVFSRLRPPFAMSSRLSLRHRRRLPLLHLETRPKYLNTCRNGALSIPTRSRASVPSAVLFEGTVSSPSVLAVAVQFSVDPLRATLNRCHLSSSRTNVSRRLGRC